MLEPAHTEYVRLLGVVILMAIQGKQWRYFCNLGEVTLPDFN